MLNAFLLKIWSLLEDIYKCYSSVETARQSRQKEHVPVIRNVSKSHKINRGRKLIRTPLKSKESHNTSNKEKQKPRSLSAQKRSTKTNEEKIVVRSTSRPRSMSPTPVKEKRDKQRFLLVPSSNSAEIGFPGSGVFIPEEIGALHVQEFQNSESKKNNLTNGRNAVVDPASDIDPNEFIEITAVDEKHLRRWLSEVTS